MTNIKTKAVHIPMTDALESSVQEHFSAVLEHFEAHIVEDIQVTLIDHSAQSTEKAEVKVHVPLKGNDVHVTHKDQDMYKAIEEAAKVVAAKLRKNKGKFNKKGAESIRHTDDLIETETDESLDINDSL